MGNALIDLQRYDEALVMFNRAEELGNTHHFVQYGKALANYHLRRYTEARDLLIVLLREHATMSSAWNLLGNVEYQRDDFAAALAAYHHIIAIEPFNARAWLSVGLTFAVMQKMEDALVAYERSLTLKKDARVWYERGRALEALGRDEEALQSYEECIAWNPVYPHAWEMIGLIHFRKAQFDEASYAFEIATEQDNLSYSPWFNYGLALLRLKDDEAAVAAFQAAMRLDPSQPAVYYAITHPLCNLDRETEAFALLYKSRSLEKQPEVWFHQACGVYTYIGAYDQALVFAKEVIAIDQQNVQYWLQLGWLYSILDRIEEAFQAYERANQLEPTNELVQKRIAILCYFQETDAP